MDVVMWTAVRQEDFPECSGGLAVPAIDNCGLRQDSRCASMLGRVYSCKEQRQMSMSRNAQQTAFTLRKPPGGCSDVYHQAMECYDPYAERSQVSVDPNTGMPQVVIRRYSCE